jgi:hypothetical protein
MRAAACATVELRQIVSDSPCVIVRGVEPRTCSSSRIRADEKKGVLEVQMRRPSRCAK